MKHYYYIDGYNLLFYKYDLAQNLHTIRQTLLHDLILRTKGLKAEIIVVFDSQENLEDINLTYFKHIKIIFTKKGLCADNYIVYQLEQRSRSKHITVVTNDKELASRVRNRGHNTLTLSEFLYSNPKKISPASPKHFQPKKTHKVTKTIKPKKDQALSTEEEYYLKIFKKRWKELDSSNLQVKKPVSETDYERWLNAFTETWRKINKKEEG